MKSPILFSGTVLLIILLILSCSSHKLRADLSPEERLQAAIKLFEKKDYLDAKNQFRIITLSYSNTALADKAQYYLAECHFYLKEYILAGSEYERLMKVYTTSDYLDDAKFKLGLSYFKLSPKYALDQEYTLKAMQQFQEFLEEYKNSPLVPQVEAQLAESRDKLANKVFAAAEQYRKMNYCDAAIIYYNMVLDKYYDSRFGARAQFGIAECYSKVGKAKEAAEAYVRFVQKNPEHELAGKAKERAKAILTNPKLYYSDPEKKSKNQAAETQPQAKP